MENQTNNYYISSLHAKGVRLFKELDIKFNQRFNFIIGANSTGKTSLLRCLALCLSMNNLQDSRFDKVTEVWLDFNFNDQKYRIGQGRSMFDDVSWVQSTGYMNVQHARNNNPDKNGVDYALSSAEVDSNELISFFAPLFIGAYRKIDYLHISGMNRETPFHQRRREYRANSSLSLSGTYLPNVKQWLINRYFVVKQDWADIEKINWSWLLDNLNQIAPHNTEFSFKEIRQDLEPLFILNDKDCYLEELSAGFKSILSVILSIFEWVEATNEGDRRIVQYAEGTVIIDELDAHMHPEWQFTIRETLEYLFPRLQFIITTHSPHLIATAKPGEIIKIPKNGEGIINIEPTNKCYAGWNTDQILEDVMDVENIKTKLYQKLISQAVYCVGEKDVVGLEKAIAALRNVVHSSDAIVNVFTIQLANLKLECPS